jgi:pectin methylesterase-like acyl-CoA thioesterase
VNFIASRCFAYLFSYLVNVRLTDTLCGTKVLLRKDYETLARERGYFGNFDPFGDFDLIFGAAKQNLQIIETPIQYRARTSARLRSRVFATAGCCSRWFGSPIAN